jgi:membrane protease YdiL (CAAX protease family)
LGVAIYYGVAPSHPAIGAVPYSTGLFMLSHPLTWGVFSVTIRSAIMVLPLFIMGVIWSVVYIKTKTLRHGIIAHALVDTLNLSVWVFLNIYVPPVVGM